MICRTFPRVLSVNRVECWNFCNISQCFIQSPLLFLPLSVFANTFTFCSLSWSQLSIEVSSNDRHAVAVVCRVLLDCSVHFFDVVVRISRVGEVLTHQFDALVVYHDRCSDGPFVDVLGVDIFLPLLPVQHNSHSVFVVVFSCSHEYVFLVCLPKFWLVRLPSFARQYCIPSVAFELAYHLFDSFTSVFLSHVLL